MVVLSWSAFGEGLSRTLEEVCLATKSDVMKGTRVSCVKGELEHEPLENNN